MYIYDMRQFKFRYILVRFVNNVTSTHHYGVECDEGSTQNRFLGMLIFIRVIRGVVGSSGFV